MSSCMSAGEKSMGLKLNILLQGWVPKAAVESKQHLDGGCKWGFWLLHPTDLSSCPDSAPHKLHDLWQVYYPDWASVSSSGEKGQCRLDQVLGPTPFPFLSRSTAECFHTHDRIYAHKPDWGEIFNPCSEEGKPEVPRLQNSSDAWPFPSKGQGGLWGLLDPKRGSCLACCSCSSLLSFFHCVHTRLLLKIWGWGW